MNNKELTLKMLEISEWLADANADEVLIELDGLYMKFKLWFDDFERGGEDDKNV